MANVEGNKTLLEELIPKFIKEPDFQLSICTGSNPGDNVIGKLLSVQVSQKSEKVLNLIIKTLVTLTEKTLSEQDRLMAKLFTLFQHFTTELYFYEKVQPQMQAIVSHNLPAPHYYFGENDVANLGIRTCLVLEDLRPEKKYKMPEKVQGLSLEETLMVLEELGKFHASSYVYLQKSGVATTCNDDEVTDPLTRHNFARIVKDVDRNVQKMYINNIYRYMTEVLQTTKSLPDELLEKVKTHSEDPHGNILAAAKHSAQTYFYAITHGDLWVNNILFQYDESDSSKPINVRFIDFQQCKYASIFDELHYFIYTSTSARFRKENLKSCLDFYYKTFVKMLKEQCKYPLPKGFTIEEFYKAYNNYLHAGFCYAFVAVPFQVGIPPPPPKSEKNDHIEETIWKTSSELGDSQLNTIVTNVFENSASGLKTAALNSAVAIERLKDLCFEMNEMGVFDSKPNFNG